MLVNILIFSGIVLIFDQNFDELTRFVYLIHTFIYKKYANSLTKTMFYSLVGRFKKIKKILKRWLLTHFFTF